MGLAGCFKKVYVQAMPVLRFSSSEFLIKSNPTHLFTCTFPICTSFFLFVFSIEYVGHSVFNN